MQLPTTIHQFAIYCSGRTHDEIYAIFEDDISQDLRDQIYAIALPLESAEPARLAMQLIGAQYNVKSLKDY